MNAKKFYDFVEVTLSVRMAFEVFSPEYRLQKNAYNKKWELTYSGVSWETMDVQSTIDVEEKKAESIIGMLEMTELKLLPVHAMGLDGDTYKFSISNGFNKVSVSFWGKDDSVRDVINEIEALIPQS